MEPVYIPEPHKLIKARIRDGHGIGTVLLYQLVCGDPDIPVVHGALIASSTFDNPPMLQIYYGLLDHSGLARKLTDKELADPDVQALLVALENVSKLVSTKRAKPNRPSEPAQNPSPA